MNDKELKLECLKEATSLVKFNNEELKDRSEIIVETAKKFYTFVSGEQNK